MITALHAYVLCAVLGAPDDAPEDLPPVKVVVLPPDASRLPEDRRELVLDTMTAQLPGGPVQLVERRATTEALSGLAADCGAQSSCRAEVAGRSDAQFVVHAQVTEPRANDYAIVLQLFEAGAEEPIAGFEDVCTICSEADLERLVRERSLDLREALLRHLAPKEEEVEPPPTKIEKVVVTEAAPPAKVEVLPPSRLRLAGWSLVGAGAAGTLGGIVLLAMQGSAAGCPADPRGGPCIPLVYRTVVPGAVTAGVGLAALGTGVALVIVGKRRDANKTTAWVLPTGTGITGRF